MVKGIYILNADAYEKIYGPQERAGIAALSEIVAPPQTADSIRANMSLLAGVEVIFSGWGGPLLDEAFLAAAPKLRAVFYGAGTIRYLVTDAFWASGIPITSSYAGNAVPVAEYTLSQILFCLKRGWQHAAAVRRDKGYSRLDVPGGYGSVVGIVSLGMIGRMVCRHLQRFDLKVIAYDPFAAEADASELGVELCSLEEIFRRSDVVSLHTPWLPETVGLITGEHFAMMKPGATFINTSRGAVVREPEMIEALQQRPDLFAVLDVVWPEPPAPDSPLYTLENVVLTPHIAGSMNNECRRMGRIVVDELRRFVAGEPLRWSVTREQSARMA
ncbi:MAG: hydroxyacid dehydrogenase [Chloroflexota bacterium]|nr:hydroxyacid dehydrogenase [Chloroflexota bacterium]